MASSQGYKRGPYKRYLTDPGFTVPRQTLHNWRLRANEAETSGSVVNDRGHDTDDEDGDRRDGDRRDSDHGDIDPGASDHGDSDHGDIYEEETPRASEEVSQSAEYRAGLMVYNTYFSLQ